MARLAIFVVALLALTACAVATEEQNPIPDGFELPVINDPILSHAKARARVRHLADIVAKEPAAANDDDLEAKMAPPEDLWNGEEDPEGLHNIQHQATLKEIKALKKMIRAGRKILIMLPSKVKRLKHLQARAAHFEGVKARRIAAEKVEKQKNLLNAIKRKETEMGKKVGTLKASQSQLESNIKKLNKLISTPPPPPFKGDPHHSFLEHSTENKAQTEAEMEAEAEHQAESEINQMSESQLDQAAEAENEFTMADLE